MVSSRSTMEKFLRDWRQDALNKAQYDSAIFIGDKLLAMTRDDEDAFWLAQVHFAAGNYTRAQNLLAKQDLISSNASCRYLAAHCMIKQQHFSDALALLGEHSPTHLFVKTDSSGYTRAKRKPTTRSHLLTTSSSSRSPAVSVDESEAATRKYEAAMCYLRGLCYARQNAFDRAKESYKDALRIDVQCFEAFSQLVKNSLMSPDEEDEFMNALAFSTIRSGGGGEGGEDEPGDYVHMLYQTQLSKYRNPRAFNTAVESLSTHYGLQDNADIKLAKADLLYTQCRFKDALAITDKILEEDKHNFAVYPIHLACLYELKKNNVLFLIAHDLADTHPDEPCTWLAVGIYYFATGKIAEARRYFSKASMMDANFGPAWVGFAHTFAAEGEHDQAVTAYSTAARLFSGTHLPQVFLGMQNHAMNNMTAAEEFLKTAYTLCKTDPLLLNEMGIVFYHQDRLKEAVRMFLRALKMADEMDSDPHAWLGARTNLGHAYRRLRHYDEALEQFDQVLRDGGKDAAVFSAKGLIYLDKGMADEAVKVLHEALAIHPQDPIATELLNKALEESAATDIGLLQLTEAGLNNSGGSGNGDAGGLEGDLERFEQELEGRKLAAKIKMESRLRTRSQRGPAAGTPTAGRGKADKGKAPATRRAITTPRRSTRLSRGNLGRGDDGGEGSGLGHGRGRSISGYEGQEGDSIMEMTDDE
ncbi:anaphase-promoting complex subunit cut9 [Diplogelasinospora grovesii]|uniref:Anaphase-promoting complex subunit cut9 n=1 Tax=Diplogelasinospora grovesii TaxID=303347 RepID=A0AAN6S982_9PEZI|nr:anaphase-promoting complex subunit cut9 [Diplogelasinospora grovesii]